MTLDPRGQRFAATLTTIMFLAILATQSGWLALVHEAHALECL